MLTCSLASYEVKAHRMLRRQLLQVLDAAQALIPCIQLPRLYHTVASHGVALHSRQQRAGRAVSSPVQGLAARCCACCCLQLQMYLRRLDFSDLLTWGHMRALHAECSVPVITSVWQDTYTRLQSLIRSHSVENPSDIMSQEHMRPSSGMQLASLPPAVGSGTCQVHHTAAHEWPHDDLEHL